MKKLFLALGIVVLMLLGIPLAQRIQENTAEQNRLQTLNAIERALNLCYVQEGFYPASLDYLVENYGVLVDAKTYFVYYKTFGANIRPDVAVYRLGE